MVSLTGQSIGRYHILEQLGEGGMATVYKAYDTRLERNVAFKVLRTDLFGQAVLAQVLKRFEREAKSLAKLSHPNIVNILDYGEHEGMPYLVMEYLPGGTLKQKLGQRIPWQDAIQILLPVAHGLAYAHQHSVIHRDVKPANILMKEGNIPVLTDFGIAKLLEGTDGHTLTGSGVGIGTPEYMAPEQGIGARAIDARADIYSLGIVLYEMVTGRKPYIADTPMAVVLKQMTDPLPHPAEFVADLPESVEHILLKALAKDPSDRYENMSALITAMENTLAETQKVESSVMAVQDTNSTDTAQPSGRPARSTKPFSVMLKGLLSLIGIVGLGIGGYFAWQRWGNDLSNMFIAKDSMKKICFLMTGGDVRSFRNAAIWQGILDAAKATGSQTQSYLTGISPELVQGTLDSMYKEDCNIIVGNGEWLKEQFLESARNKPNVYFLPIDASYSGIPKPLPENLIEQIYTVYDGAYLAGYLAAGSTQTGKIGTFGGEQTETVVEFMNGFAAGAQKYNADHNTQVEVLGWDAESRTGLFAGDFNNPAAHILHASNLIQNGADTIFIVSTIEGSRGALDLANEMSDGQIKIIGVDTDWKSYLTAAPTAAGYIIFASVVKNDQVIVAEAIGELISGAYDGSPVTGKLGNGGIELIFDDEINDQLKVELDQLWEELAGVPTDSLNKNTPTPLAKITFPAPTLTNTPQPTLTPTPVPTWITDFASPILTYIANRPPNYEDDFEPSSNAWHLYNYCADWRLTFEDGKMYIAECGAEYQGVTFNDYVVDVTVSLINNNARAELGFRNLCVFLVEIGSARASCGFIRNGDVTGLNVQKEYDFSDSDTFKLRLIAKGGHFAFYVNGEPLGYFEEDALRYGQQLEINAGTPGDGSVRGTDISGAFDDFKIWNITNLEIP